MRGRLVCVFGIANFAIARRTEPNLEALTSDLLTDLQGQSPASFRVTARRADKRFPLPSPEIERQIGARVQATFGWPVRLNDPDLNIRVEFVTNEAFYYFGRERGAGGLPVGVSGRVVCLLSGGIDSPVAAWRMMRRGCAVRLVHFHSYPFLEATSQEKVREIAKLLARYQLNVRLHQVPFGAVQRQVVVAVRPALRVVIYRRLMLRIAEAIARDAGARALVTGEVLGQVASQTLDNLTVIAAAASMPILRPLVGHGQGRDRRRGRAHRHVPDLDHPRPGLLPAVHAPASRHAGETGRDRGGREGLATHELVGSAVRDAVVEDYRFPVVQSPVRSDC